MLGSDPTPPVVVHPEVAQAIHEGKAVVALESTIIAHGMPFPQNKETATRLEQIVRQNGAIPATIAVLQGRAVVGLTSTQLHQLATDNTVRKLALRDLPLAYVRGENGATTVSATMHVANQCGIKVFATGGIGGVHRDIAESWDISADVAALASIPMMVVCAGVKSILDIRKTLEALETASVPVLVLGSDDFPGFYTRRSGEVAPAHIRSAAEAASVFTRMREAGLRGGMLLAVPVGVEDEADARQVQYAIGKALQEARQQDVSAKAVTPFLLRRISELTDGASLTTNMLLAENNAAAAAAVATSLARRRGSAAVAAVDLAVFGAVALDVVCRGEDGQMAARTTGLGRVRLRSGGVGWNMALAAARFTDASVHLTSAVGNDAMGRVIRMMTHDMERTERNLRTQLREIQGCNSSAVCLIQDADGDLSVRTRKQTAMTGCGFTLSA